jgi:hypothetical protein
VLAATCDDDRLVFFDTRPALGLVGAADPGHDGLDAERSRDFLLRYLDTARERLAEASAAIRRTSDRELQLILSSRWWRLIAPLRRLSASVQDAACRARHTLTRRA